MNRDDPTQDLASVGRQRAPRVPLLRFVAVLNGRRVDVPGWREIRPELIADLHTMQAAVRESVARERLREQQPESRRAETIGDVYYLRERTSPERWDTPAR